MGKAPFEEYIIESEPTRQGKANAWRTAIGLQVIAGLQASEYLERIASKNIDGEIALQEVDVLLQTYYNKNPTNDSRIEEADKVAARTATLLCEHAFSFTPIEYISIHRRLFSGIYFTAGQIRDYSITGSELCGTASEPREDLEQVFSAERGFSYKGLSMSETIRHLADFISRLWRLHIFAEGNTMATAVFFIKYLQSLGFREAGEAFAENALCFQNALTRANYSDRGTGEREMTECVELFLRNLLLGEGHQA